MRFSLILLLAVGCGSFDGTDEPAPGRRLVTGRLQPPDASIFLTRQHFALELVAASLDARQEEPVLSFVPGIAFSPSSNSGQPVTFRIALPADRTYALFFQAPVEGSGGIGQLVAPVRFPSGDGATTDILSGRIPGSTAPAADLDLGVVEISVASDIVCEGGEVCSRTFQVLLGGGNTRNPLQSSDADGDGTPDLEDSDDDDDLIPDEADEDQNGDDVPDQFQSLDALADGDADGVPDRFQSIQ